MRWLACAVILTGCTTEGTAFMEADAEASHLKCVGYCDLTISDRSVEVEGEVELKEIESESSDER